MSLEIHPAALLFPMMSNGELKKLADDIGANGLLEPIIMFQGQVLDGRNRLAACELAAVHPRFIELSLETVSSPTLYVLSLNLHRRHLSTSQRAAIGAEAMALIQEEKQNKSISNLMNQNSIGPIGHIEAGRSRDIVAREVQASPRSIQRAWDVKHSDPEIFERVKRGEISVHAAANGHKKQPQIGGQQPTAYSPDTPRKRQLANSSKKRLGDGLAMLGGLCRGLGELDLAMAAAACDRQEINEWAEKAETHARELKKFAARLRGTKSNGKAS